jgi:hypothetical protein
MKGPKQYFIGLITHDFVAKGISKIDPHILSWANKTTRIGTKPRTQQGKQITRNASLN